MATNNAIQAMLAELGLSTNSSLDVGGSYADIEGTLNVDGATTLGSTLAVVGAVSGASLSPASGTITRVAFGVTASIVGGANVTVTHALGTAPTAVIVTCGFVSTTPLACVSAVGATTFLLTNESANNGIFYWLAIS